MSTSITSADEIKASVKEFILAEFLPDEDPDLLEDTTPLISGGVVDSISTVELVSFLEEQFGVEFKAREITEKYLDTLNDITATIQSKIA